MRIRGFLGSLLTVSLLSGCGTSDGTMSEKFSDMGNWFHGRSSAMETSLGPMPVAYTGQRTRYVLKPPAAAVTEAPVQE